MVRGPATSFLNESEHPTRQHWVILGMCWSGWLFDFYDLMLFSFLLVPIQQSLGVSETALALLLGTSLAATALGGIAFGALADRFGRRSVLSWTILVYSLGTFLCGMSGGVGSLLIARIVTGLGVGGEWATGQTLIGETFSPQTRARYAALMQTGAPLGIALAALMGGFAAPAFANQLGPDWGWRACFLLSLSMAKSGAWLLVTQAGGFLGYLGFGVVADRLGRRIAYSGFSLVWAIGLLAVTLFWGAIAAWPALTLAFMFLVGIGTGSFSGYGPIFTELFPTRVRNTAMGTAFNLARGVQFVTPFAIARIATRYGLAGGISLAAFFALFTGAWVWLLPETRGTKVSAD